MDKKELLKTEYSETFDNIRKNMVCISYFKYGPAKINFEGKLTNTIESLKRYLKKYEETGNTEYLADVANFAMFEFMFKQKEGAYYKPTDSDGSPGLHGMAINEIKRFKEGV